MVFEVGHAIKMRPLITDLGSYIYGALFKALAYNSRSMHIYLRDCIHPFSVVTIFALTQHAPIIINNIASLAQ